MRILILVMIVAVTQTVYGQGVSPFVNTHIADACQDDAYLLQLFCLGQVPENHNAEPVKILINHGYALGYSEIRRNPIWAVYKASGSTGMPFRSERSDFFPRDLRTVSKVHGQTFGGGMDRGHMVPNAAIGNQYGALSQMETFLMSNMSPQSANLNRGPWARLERFVAQLANERKHVFVFCGPIFGDDPSIIENGPERKIQIPDSFYMILIDTKREFSLNFETGNLPPVEILAYVFPQDVARGDDFRDRDKFGASIDDIETLTGLNFFPGAEQIGGDAWTTLESTKVMEHIELFNEG